MEKKEQKITKSFVSFTLATIISRILGYIRDASVAFFFGGGWITDAFYAAYRIPNLFRRLLGEGAMNAAFIPVFVENLKKNNDQKHLKIYYASFSSLIIILIIITTLGIIFSKQITSFIAYGFSLTPQKLHLTFRLTQIMFPYLIFICLATLASGVLNSLRKFFLPAAAPSFLSISEITFIILMFLVIKTSILTFNSQQLIYGLAISVLIGGALHWTVQLPLLYKENLKLKFINPLNQPQIKEIGIKLLPAMFAFSIDQLNTFVDTICASFLEHGSVTALYNSNRVVQLPFALFGIAISTVSLPELSNYYSLKDLEKFKETFTFAIRMVIFTVFPAMIGLMILSLPIVQLLFQHGQFTFSDSLRTHNALFFYSFGLLAFALQKVLVTTFYSIKDTVTPVKVGLFGLFMNAFLNVILMQKLNVGGLALSTSIASWFMVFLLFIDLKKRIDFRIAKQIIKLNILISIISIFMILAIKLVDMLFYSNNFFNVTISIIVGILVYILLSIVFDIKERKPLFNLLIKEKQQIIED